MDHIVPLIREGKSTRSNSVPACKECNSRKKYLLPIEWDQYVRISGNAYSDSEGPLKRTELKDIENGTM